MKRLACLFAFVALAISGAAADENPLVPVPDGARNAPAMPVPPITECETKSGLSRALVIVDPDSGTLAAAPLDDVIAACRTAADQFPGVAYYQFALALALERRNDEAGALAAFDRARELGLLGGLDGYANLEIWAAPPLRDAKAGVALYEDAIAANPHPELMRGLALALALGPPEIRDVNRARELLHRAIEAGNVPALATLADLESATGAKDEALRLREQAIHKGSLYAAYRVGNDLFRVGRYSEAGPYLEKVAASRISSAPQAMVDLGAIAANALAYDRALAQFHRAADLGSAEAMRRIGDLASNGRGMARDFAEARRFYLKAAEQGNGAAMNELGMQSDHGRGVPVDYAQSLAWYLKGAARGDANSMSNIGFIYEMGNGVDKDFVKARQWYQRAIDADNSATTRHSMAMMMIEGRGGPKDVARGVAMLFGAATEGEPTSINDLGYIYGEGLGVPRDLVKARRFYKMAADRNFPLGMHNYAAVLEDGAGGPIDLATAKTLFRKAAESGEVKESAYRYAMRLYADGEVEEARRWLRRSLEAGDPLGLTLLASMASNGVGGPVDAQLALDAYEKLAGDKDADRVAFAWRMRRGDGVPKDAVRARALFRTLGAKGVDGADAAYTDMQLRGEGGSADRDQALGALNSAVARGDAAAMVVLAQGLRDGAAGARNSNRARELLSAAADKGEPSALLPLIEMLSAGEGGPVDLEGTAERFVRAPRPPESDLVKVAELGASIALKLVSPGPDGRVDPRRAALAGQLMASVTAKMRGD